MPKMERKLSQWSVPAMGLGCMNLSHAYGTPPSIEEAKKVLHRALDLGVRHFDIAPLYGFGRNEELVGPFLKPYRKDLVLVSKCGMRGIDGVRTIDGRPEMLRADIEASLKRLQTDVIDLYYLHRFDKLAPVPIEDSVGEMAKMVQEGKVKAIGLSEVSADTIRAAQNVHPIAAVQSEYSLWSRNVELGVLDACRELDIAFVAFSPLGRGFLTSTDLVPEQFADKDIRRGMPRFNEPHFSENLQWLPKFRAFADKAGCSPAQLALAWVLSQGDNIHVIPGTTSEAHLVENWQAMDVNLDSDLVSELSSLVSQSIVSGPRYPAATQLEIDTEEF
jgi:aryl-alcohol dehydrogenase-like predicted oxidoreductase